MEIERWASAERAEGNREMLYAHIDGGVFFVTLQPKHD